MPKMACSMRNYLIQSIEKERAVENVIGELSGNVRGA